MGLKHAYFSQNAGLMRPGYCVWHCHLVAEQQFELKETLAVVAVELVATPDVLQPQQLLLFDVAVAERLSALKTAPSVVVVAAAAAVGQLAAVHALPAVNVAAADVAVVREKLTKTQILS